MMRNRYFFFLFPPLFDEVFVLTLQHAFTERLESSGVVDHVLTIHAPQSPTGKESEHQNP